MPENEIKKAPVEQLQMNAVSVPEPLLLSPLQHQHSARRVMQKKCRA